MHPAAAPRKSHLACHVRPENSRDASAGKSFHTAECGHFQFSRPMRGDDSWLYLLFPLVDLVVASPGSSTPATFGLVLVGLRCAMRPPFEIIADSRSFSIEHLAPFVFGCPCEAVGRDLQIQVAFSNHCYTSGFDAAVHRAKDIVLREHNRVARVFDFARYELSKLLPSIIANLPARKVNQSAAERNYVYASSVMLPPLAGQVGKIGTAVTYQVFFSLRRASKGAGHDLRMVVESAYSLEGPPRVSKRPSAIRFHILALRIFQGKQIRFAVR